MKRIALNTILLSFLLAMFVSPALAITITDGTFNNSDWSTTKVADTTPNNDASSNTTRLVADFLVSIGLRNITGKCPVQIALLSHLLISITRFHTISLPKALLSPFHTRLMPSLVGIAPNGPKREDTFSLLSKTATIMCHKEHMRI